MARSAAKSASPAKKPASPAEKSSGKKPAVVANDDGEDGEVIEPTPEVVEPPPPEAVEPDPQMTPEEVEEARKSYLLTRFWISARGFWSRNGSRLAWLLSIGLAILIVGNVA